jgi:hypothetical protein
LQPAPDGPTQDADAPETHSSDAVYAALVDGGGASSTASTNHRGQQGAKGAGQSAAGSTDDVAP